MLRLFVGLFFVNGAMCIMCFNCSASHKNWSSCGEGLVQIYPKINNEHYKKTAVNCTGGEGAVCFVRWWRARSRHAWLLQRGCYSMPRDEQPALIFAQCNTDRSPEAEFRTCFCQSDWCNTSSALAFTWTVTLMTIFCSFLLRFT